MRKLTKILALTLAILMVSGMAFTAIFAAPADMPTGSSGVAGSGVTITVNRDSTYAGAGESGGRTLKWYRVFSATYTGSISSTGGGYESGTGKPGDVTSAPSGTAISYIASPAVAAKLGTIASGTGAWTTNAGNQWFDLTYTPGTGNYIVAWRTGVEKDADTVQAAAQWLLANKVYEAYGDFTENGSKWEAEVGKGYYVLQSLAGDNLIAATTDINVNEKNEYPDLDKTQSDEDSGTKNDATRSVAIGDVLDYEVKVTIPVTAAVGDKIIVWDKPSNGLTYNGTVTWAAVAGTTINEVDPEEGQSWRAVIVIDEESARGKEVVFSFSMTVNNNAIVDTGKKNESGLSYGRGPGSGTSGTFPYDSVPDKVEYTTFFGGIFKHNKENEPLSGVKFDLYEDGKPFYVTKSGSYYIPASGTNYEVVTDGSGTIHIRGLDDDKTYTLTETATLDGYNLLTEDVTLILHPDTTSVTTYTPAKSFEAGKTYYINNGSDYVEAGEITEFESGTTYYTASTASSGTYDSSVKQAWEVPVLNEKGSILPSTGGIGTTIFYIVGGLMAVSAGVVLVSRKRMGKEDN